MRKKTSLMLDETTYELAKTTAATEGLDVGRWLDRAIQHEAGRDEVDAIEAWYASMNPEEQAITAALQAGDRDGWPEA